MEVQVNIRFEARDVVAADWVETLLGDDPPIFEDELPEAYRYLFNVIEDLHAPEYSKRSAKQRFDMSFLMGGSWEADVYQALELLSSISDKSIWCYYCMDETEGFFASSKDNGITELQSWKEGLKRQGI